MAEWREHNPPGEDCWCKHSYPVTVNGENVGTATPLEDGNYSIQFKDDFFSQRAKQRIAKGFPDFVIHEPVQGELFTAEETE